MVKAKQVAVCLKPDEIKALLRLAIDDDRTMSDYCARVLRSHLKSKETT